MLHSYIATNVNKDSYVLKQAFMLSSKMSNSIPNGLIPKINFKHWMLFNKLKSI